MDPSFLDVTKADVLENIDCLNCRFFKYQSRLRGAAPEAQVARRCPEPEAYKGDCDRKSSKSVRGEN